MCPSVASVPPERLYLAQMAASSRSVTRPFGGCGRRVIGTLAEAGQARLGQTVDRPHHNNRPGNSVHKPAAADRETESGLDY